MRLRAERGLDRGRAGADEPEDQPVEHDADHDDQRQRQRDRFPQHRTQRRREYLGEGFDGVVEHFSSLQGGRGSDAGSRAQVAIRFATDRLAALIAWMLVVRVVQAIKAAFWAISQEIWSLIVAARSANQAATAPASWSADCGASDVRASSSGAWGKSAHCSAL